MSNVVLADLDSTLIHMHGNYNQEGENIIKISRGYSRDHRLDLQQFIINLICSNDGNIPLFLKASSGNEVDSPPFWSNIINSPLLKGG